MGRKAGFLLREAEASRSRWTLDTGHDRRGHQLSPWTLHGVRAQHNNWSLSPLLDHLFPSQNLCSPDHGQSPAGLQRRGDREL